MFIHRTITFIIAFTFFCSSLQAGTYFPVYNVNFWIKQLQNPDEVILTAEEIGELNRNILDESDDMADIYEMEDSVSEEELMEWLLSEPLPLDKTMYDKRGKIIKEEFYNNLMDNINIEGVKESNEPAFGVVIDRADIRAFPTDESVVIGPSAGGFDTFQYSAIYPPQPVALLHKTKDERWGLFQTPFVRGWIRMDKIAFAKTRDEIEPPAEKSLVITGSMVNIFADIQNRKVVKTVPMGTTLPLYGEDRNNWIVKFPEKAKDGQLKWIDARIAKKSDVNIGPLPYTKRNVIKQAFKMLGEKYGWGGRDGLRDCSSFTKDAFATMGINLPRHSSHQAEVGVVAANIEESATPDDIQKAMDGAIPGITLLAFDGHIMLYLGAINGGYYTLHQFFGYSSRDGFRTVNKAVVTNLDLGKDSKNGPMKSRIKSVNSILLERTN